MRMNSKRVNQMKLEKQMKMPSLRAVATSLLLLGVLSAPLGEAETAVPTETLKLESDLLIQPEQLEQVVQARTLQLKSIESYSWSHLNFSKPYRTAWKNVRVEGPLRVQVDTSMLNQQLLSVSITWPTPKISVGAFAIQDTIRRIVGGIPVVVHLDGTCSNLNLQLPNAEMMLRGKLRWQLSESGVKVSWLDFTLDMQSDKLNLDVGDCVGPKALIATIKDSITEAMRDPRWLEAQLRRSTEEWLEDNLKKLARDLLAPQLLPLTDRLGAAWIPAHVTSLESGAIRVAGEIQLSSPKALSPTTNKEEPLIQSNERLVQRAPNILVHLSKTMSSGFALPVSTPQEVLAFVYRNGFLKRRFVSTEIPAFVDLMQSRFMQFFIWPDLMQFRKRSVFYFDLAAAAEPQWSNQTLTVPFQINQWAPIKGRYIPYLTFRGSLTAQIRPQLNSEQVQFQPKIRELKFKAYIQPEFKKNRPFEGGVATSAMEGKIRDYLEQQTLQMERPTWEVLPGVNVELTNVQLNSKELLFLPLQLR